MSTAEEMQHRLIIARNRNFMNGTSTQLVATCEHTECCVEMDRTRKTA
jgi:hypothetical protein